MKKRITAFLVAVMFLLSLAVLATDMTVEAAGANAVQSVAVRIGSKSVAKKNTYAYSRGKCTAKGVRIACGSGEVHPLCIEGQWDCVCK